MNKMDIDNILRERYVSDLRKPEVDNKERAVILKKLCDAQGWSVRELARQFGFKKSTVQDWMLWDDERVDKLRTQGFSETEIYKVLRNNTETKQKRTGKKVKTKEELEASIVDEHLRKMASDVRGMISTGKYTTETREFISNLINQCNRFDSLIKRELNGNGVKKTKVKKTKKVKKRGK